jgi:hypothetical protein
VVVVVMFQHEAAKQRNRNGDGEYNKSHEIRTKKKGRKQTAVPEKEWWWKMEQRKHYLSLQIL